MKSARHLSGEATDEETLDEIMRRGPRMTYWLEHFRKMPPCGWQIFEGLLVTGDVRDRNYVSALEMIVKGESPGLD